MTASLIYREGRSGSPGSVDDIVCFIVYSGAVETRLPDSLLFVGALVGIALRWTGG